MAKNAGIGRQSQVERNITFTFHCECGSDTFALRVLRNFVLLGTVMISGDSPKLRAQNGKNNNSDQKKVAPHIEYIDKKLAEHEETLAKNDKDNDRREKYETINKINEDTGTKGPRLPTSGPDSRHQSIRGTITKVSYTTRTTVDNDQTSGRNETTGKL